MPGSAGGAGRGFIGWTAGGGPQELADPAGEPAVPVSAAALARIPAIHPVEAVIPASWHNSTVAR